MHNYHDSHGRMPPAVVYGENGKPLLSWRVLILPFIEQQDLYARFKLDEAWDSPHNSQLLAEMPMTYAVPRGKRSKTPLYHTVCKVFFGKSAAFEGRELLRLPNDFPDGTSNTILIAETGEPVPWTKPEDLAFDPDGPLPDLRSMFRNGFRVALGDGTVRWVSDTVSERTLRAAITRNGGETLRADW